LGYPLLSSRRASPVVHRVQASPCVCMLVCAYVCLCNVWKFVGMNVCLWSADACCPGQAKFDLYDVCYQHAVSFAASSNRDFGCVAAGPAPPPLLPPSYASLTWPCPDSVRCVVMHLFRSVLQKMRSVHQSLQAEFPRVVEDARAHSQQVCTTNPQQPPPPRIVCVSTHANCAFGRTWRAEDCHRRPVPPRSPAPRSVWWRWNPSSHGCSPRRPSCLTPRSSWSKKPPLPRRKRHSSSSPPPSACVLRVCCGCGDGGGVVLVLRLHPGVLHLPPPSSRDAVRSRLRPLRCTWARRPRWRSSFAWSDSGSSRS
jgi:hypothetical protein